MDKLRNVGYDTEDWLSSYVSNYPYSLDAISDLINWVLFSNIWKENIKWRIKTLFIMNEY